jgi:hypothetical protein
MRNEQGGIGHGGGSRQLLHARGIGEGEGPQQQPGRANRRLRGHGALSRVWG